MLNGGKGRPLRGSSWVALYRSLVRDKHGEFPICGHFASLSSCDTRFRKAWLRKALNAAQVNASFLCYSNILFSRIPVSKHEPQPFILLQHPNHEACWRNSPRCPRPERVLLCYLSIRVVVVHPNYLHCFVQHHLSIIGMFCEPSGPATAR